MSEHEKRIRDFLSGRATMRGLCPEQIAGANDSRLNASDLRALLADLDGVRGALKSVQAAIYMDDAGQIRLTRSFDESVINYALKGAEA